MNSQERWLKTINREKTDRIPTDYWSTPEVTLRLQKELGCATQDELWRKLGVDKSHWVSPAYVGPARGTNLWGVKTRKVEVADGEGTYEEPEDHPLAQASTLEELKNYSWPQPDWFDYSKIQANLSQLHRDGWPVFGGYYEPLLIYCSLRSMENAYQDMIERPELIEFGLEQIFKFYYEVNARIFEAGQGGGGIDFTYVAEDLGSQQSLLFSEKMIERFLFPRMKKMIDLAKSHGIHIFYHSDGSILPVIPRLIQLGVEILNPIQWRCKGMDRKLLNSNFGGKVVFHGGIDNQQTLPFGSVKDVEDEVVESIGLLGSGGGYILGPCHNIQPNTPTANIVAMYRAANGVPSV